MPSFANMAGNFQDSNAGGEPAQVFNPATGTTIQLRRGSKFYINNAATLAALTINLPATPRGTEVSIGFKSAVTALSIRDRLGVVVPGVATAAAAGDAFSFLHISRLLGWVKWV